ncbi:MAG: zinc ribbon domain-containing protein [Chloroflexi bacterium]|nr:zinc ribbon domain-containing protein [Chloroflexota bacterium]
MPIYEYVCSSCKQKFELLRPMSQAVEAGACPACGSPAQRVVSRAARLSGASGEGPLPGSGSSGCSSCSSSSCSTCAS